MFRGCALTLYSFETGIQPRNWPHTELGKALTAIQHAVSAKKKKEQ